VSKHHSTSLFRFCLVSLLAAARLLCPCPSLEAASAAEPERANTHSCCDETKSGRADTDHSHRDGCEHCPDAPQMKPATVAGEAAPAAVASEPHFPPAYLTATSAIAVVPHIRIPRDAAHPPQTLISLRTVVLLI
jgi:hypothetical protein